MAVWERCWFPQKGINCPRLAAESKVLKPVNVEASAKQNSSEFSGGG